MMEELGWKPLHERRSEQHLTLLYKIINDLVAIIILADHHIPYTTTKDQAQTEQSKIENANSELYRNSFFPRTINPYRPSFLFKGDLGKQ